MQKYTKYGRGGFIDYTWGLPGSPPGDTGRARWVPPSQGGTPTSEGTHPEKEGLSGNDYYRLNGNGRCAKTEYTLGALGFPGVLWGNNSTSNGNSNSNSPPIWRSREAERLRCWMLRSWR